MAILDELLLSILSGATGVQSPALGRLADERAQARSLGISVEDLRKRQREQFEIQQQKQAAELAALNAGVKSATRENDLADAAITAKTGFRPGEGQQDLTLLADPARPGVARTFQGSFEDLAASARAGGTPLTPGLYTTDRGRTREELAGEFDFNRAEADRLREIDEQIFERGVKMATQEREDERTRQAEDRLQIDRAQLGVAEEAERRKREYTDLHMQHLQLQMEKLRESGKPELSDGQAMQMAYNILGDEIDVDDEDAGLDVASLARDLKAYYADPSGGFANTRRAIQDSFDKYEDRGRRGDFGDAEIARQGVQLPPDLQRPEPQPEPPKPLPAVPARQGEPNPQALDPNNPLRDLLGGNPDVNAAIHEAALTEDQQRFEAQIRHLLSMGIPEDEWPENLKLFAEVVRNPGQGRGLK